MCSTTPSKYTRHWPFFRLSRGRGLERGGFALVIAVTLMAFIVLLLLSMMTLVRVESRQSELRSGILQARQNALFGAMLALGEVQKLSGPDQAVTASAGILDQTPESGLVTGVSEPHWTGVWTTDWTNPALASGGDPYDRLAAMKQGVAGNPGGALEWLVSMPPDSDRDPLNHIRSANDVPLLLIDGADLSDNRNVYLPRTPIGTTGGDHQANFAWWVGDEGAKASITLQNDWARSDDNVDRRISLLTASRAAPEFIVATEEEPDVLLLFGLQDPYDQQLSRLQNLPGLGILLRDVGSSEVVWKNFNHDLTPLARGVIADVRHGGLKRNLTAAFSDDDAFQDHISHHGGELIFGRRVADGLLSNGSIPSPVDRHDPGGPPWAQLRSFFRLGLNGSVSGSNPSIAPRAQRNDQMGVSPVISHFQMHFHVLMLEAEGSTTSNPKYVFRLIAIPSIVLWNPYSVELETTDYVVYFSEGSGDTLHYNWRVEINYDYEGTAGIDSTTFVSDFFSETASNATRTRNRPYRFDVQTSLAPGEARLFRPADVIPRAIPYTAGHRLEDASASILGGYIYNDLPDHFEPMGRIVGDIRLEMYGSGSPVGPRMSTNFVSLHRTDDLPANNPNAFSVVPLQTIGGFNHYKLNNDRYTWSIPSQANEYIENEFPTFENWKDYSLYDIDPAVGLGGTFTPAVGVYAHYRWMENSFAPGYASSSTSPGWDPQYAFLAHFNPRSTRNWRTPVESRQEHFADNRLSPQYYDGTEFGSGMNALVTAWSAVEAMVGAPVSVGFSDDTFSSVKNSTLFDLPMGPEFFQSIASLQHAYLSAPEPGLMGQYVNSSNSDSTYPAFAVGNSIAPLYVPLSQRTKYQWTTSSNMGSDPGTSYYDWSYLLNDRLWDGYFFAPYDEEYERSLNPRLSFAEAGQRDLASSYEEAASVLMIDGSFNVNSTSVDAWKALLGGLVGAPVEQLSGSVHNHTNRSPYVRNLSPLLGTADNSQIRDAEAYAGYRSLGADEIESLAEEIVVQVKKRGPFISMSHFVNRVIDDPDFRSARENSNLSGRERAIGALQAALEKSVVNEAYTVDPTFVLTEADLAPRIEQYEMLTAIGPKAFGQAGYVTQADILSRIGAVLSPRSDTFKIRSYGENLDPLTGQTISEAWCEMVVQRIPETIDGRDDERRYEIVFFRWLDESEI